MDPIQKLIDALKPPHVLIGQRSVPTCGRGDSDPRDQPEHCVDVELLPAAAHAVAVLPEIAKHLTAIFNVSSLDEDAGADEMYGAVKKVNAIADIARDLAVNISAEDEEPEEPLPEVARHPHMLAKRIANTISHHGIESGPEHMVGDTEQILEVVLNLLTPTQIRFMFRDSRVREVFECGYETDATGLETLLA